MSATTDTGPSSSWSDFTGLSLTFKMRLLVNIFCFNRTSLSNWKTCLLCPLPIFSFVFSVSGIQLC